MSINTMPMSSTVYGLLLENARSGMRIDLAQAGLRATFEQARTLAEAMRKPGILTLRREWFDDEEQIRLRFLECSFEHEDYGSW